MATAHLDEVSGDYFVRLQSGEKVTLTISLMIKRLSSNWLEAYPKRLSPSVRSFPTASFVAKDEALLFEKKSHAEEAAEAITEIGVTIGLPIF